MRTDWQKRPASYEEDGAQVISLNIFIHFALFQNLLLYYKILQASIAEEQQGQ